MLGSSRPLFLVWIRILLVARNAGPPWRWLYDIATVHAGRSRTAVERDNHLRLGDEVELDIRNLSGRRGKETLSFTRREMDILQHLATNPERPVSREELLTQVWGYANGLHLETRTVDIHIAKLRRKIESDPAKPCTLITVRGAGYRLLMK